MGALGKSDDRDAPKGWPTDSTLPYVARRSIPVITTLDGEVSYPQLVKRNHSHSSNTVALSAQFLGW